MDDDVRPVWMTRGRAEDAGLEDAWDEDCERFDAIKAHAEAVIAKCRWPEVRAEASAILEVLTRPL